MIGAEVQADDLIFSCGSSGVLKSLQPREDVRPKTPSQNVVHGQAHSGEACRRSGRCQPDAESIADLGKDIVKSLRSWLLGEQESFEKKDLQEKVTRLDHSCGICEQQNEPQPEPPPPQKVHRAHGKNISILYPWDGPNQQKVGKYNRSVFMNAVRHAIHTGTDPYLALAVVMQENPPTNLERFYPYSEKRGVIPVDQTGAYEELDCFAKDRGPDRFPTLTDAEVDAYRKIYAEYDSAREGYNRAVSQGLLNREYDSIMNRIAILKDQIEDFQQLHPRSKFEFSLAGLKKAVAVDPRLAQLKNALAVEQKRLDLFLKDKKSAEAVQLVEAYRKGEEKLTRFRAVVSSQKGPKSQQALEELGCSIDRRKCFGFVGSQKRIPEADLSFLDGGESGGLVRSTFCSQSNRVAVGEGPHFQNGFKENSCCLKVTATRDVKNLQTHVKTWLGASYLKSHIQACIASGRSKLTYCLQKFNGTGCFGCTESSTNDCFNGIVMEDRPVYGARVADLMLNSLMSQPEVREMIEAVSAEMGQPITSVFCYDHPESRFLIPGDQFYQEQRSYLLEGAQHSYKMKLTSGTLGIPKSSEERNAYLARERSRANACQFLFR